MKKLLFFSLILTLIFSCGNGVKEEISSNQAFSSFISAYTSGIITKNSTIRVKLTESVGDDFDMGKEMDNSIFSFSPSKKGKQIG